MFRYPHKVFEKNKIRLIAQADSVVDIGGGKRFGKWLAEYRHLFDETKYKTLDFDSGSNPDMTGDIHHLPFVDGTVGAVICASVLEHVEDPKRAVEEIHRILRPDGAAFFSVPSIYPYHAAAGHYKDYWRFFDDGLAVLFRDWHHVEIEKVGGYFKALFFFIPLQHRLQWLLAPLAYLLDALFRTRARHTTSGYLIYGEK